MSWSELERLVEEAEADASLRRALGHCRSIAELLLACGRLGYGIERQDLKLARRLHRGETGASVPGAEPAGPGRHG
jgi:hypothetical protein